MTAINTDIPAGFERHFRQSPLTEPWEPLYSKRTDRAVIIGLRLAKPHTNRRGLIHGGAIPPPSANPDGLRRAQSTGRASALVARWGSGRTENAGLCVFGIPGFAGGRPLNNFSPPNRQSAVSVTRSMNARTLADSSRDVG